MDFGLRVPEYSALKKRTDARGVETHYKQDALHRITNIWYTGLGGDDSGSVRPGLPSGVAGTGDVLYGYTAWGALSSVTIPSQYGETYAFDEFSRPTSVTRWLGQVYTGYKTYTTSYEYNQGSQLTKMIYPSGQQVVVNHDDKGRVQSLSGVTGMSYNIAGQVTGLTLGNGVVESYGYNANRLQLTSQTATKSGNQLMNLTYNYQATAGQMGTGSTAGNAGQLMSISGTINSTTESASYTYDLLGRLLTSDQTSNGSSGQRLFEYDRWGNRTAVYDGLPGGKTPPTQIQSLQLQQSGGVPTNRITSVTNSGSTVNYVYDAAGNVTNDGAHAYTYDAENRAVSVDGGVTAQYKYDHQNRRVTKTVGSSWTHYIWEGSQVIGEHDATTPVPGYGQPPYQELSARLDYIYTGSRMIRSRQRTSSTGSWTTRYYLSDRLSVRMTLDTNGNVLGRQAHLPFGEDFGESGAQEKHHFTSYETDGEIANDYAMNRQYAPNLGRFMRADPYRASGRLTAPQSWNRYTYAENEPIDQTDPMGLNLAICYWSLGAVAWGGQDGVFYAVIGLVFEGCVDGGGGGGSLDSDPGRGSGGQLKNLTPKDSAKAFLEDKPKCEKKINEAAKKAGFGKIRDTLKGLTFLNATLADDVSDATLDMTLRELKFPTWLSEAELNSKLSSHVGIFPKDIALINPTTHTVYLSSLWDNHSIKPIDSIIVHEALHDLFQGDHKKVAEKLGLSTDGTDTEISDRISAWLDNGCK